MEEFLKIENLDVVYTGKNEKTKAIENVNLTLNRGDFAAILGPSGCGKTTLLNVIAGFIKPISGSCKLKGEIVQKPGKDRGVIFQDANLFPWLTIEENVKFGPNINDMDKKMLEESYDDYMDIIGLKKYEKHYPFEISGGMKQRVAIARTMINAPELTLMDEPFGALDAVTKKKLQHFLREIWAKHKFTVMMITHDIDEALSLATKVYVMGSSPGKIMKKFNVDFYKRILNGEEKIELDREFLQIKSEILEIISKNNNAEEVFIEKKKR